VLTAVAFVPSPPAFVPQLMGRAAHELDGLRAAADTALGALVDALLAPTGGAAGADGPGCPATGPAPRLVVVGPGAPSEHVAAGPVGFGEFGLEVDLPALPGGPQLRTGSLPTPILVGRCLAGRVTGRAAAVDRLWTTARWVTTDAAMGTALGAELAASPVPTGLLLLADGAACHGPKAPRAEDSRAVAYEEAVNDALAAGDPAALAALDPHLGDELGATGPQLWPLLSAATDGAQWSGELLHRDAPYGVGWSVAVWRRVPAAGPVGAPSVAQGA
jgi:hypothetical protein